MNKQKYFKSAVPVAIILATTSLTATVQEVKVAQAEEISGDFGYTINTATVGSEYAVITSYKGTTKDVIIPETLGGYPVKEISREVFSASIIGFQITSVVFPKNLEIIGSDAFLGADINTVTLPRNIKKIEMSTFGLANVQNLVLNEGIESISHSSFSGNSIETLVIPKSLKSLGMGVFSLENTKTAVLLSYDTNYTSVLNGTYRKGINYYGIKGSDAETFIKGKGDPFKYVTGYEFTATTSAVKIKTVPTNTTVLSKKFVISSSPTPPETGYNDFYDSMSIRLPKKDIEYLHLQITEQLSEEVNSPTVTYFRTFIRSDLETKSVETPDIGANKTSGNHELNVGLKPGDFSVKFDSLGNFGTAKLSNEMQSMSLPITNLRVIDDRGTREGWTLTASATPVTTDDGDSLPVGSLVVGEYAVQGDATTYTNATNNIDGSSIVLASATEGKGLGTTTFNFLGQQQEALTINFNSVTAKSKTYKSTVTFNLVSGPTN